MGEIEFSVTIEPRPGTIAVREGETVMAAAIRLGYRWPTVCGGQGECRVCAMELMSDDTGLSPADQFEEHAIEESFAGMRRRGKVMRLACQAKVIGEGVTVLKRGVRPADDDQRGVGPQ